MRMRRHPLGSRAAGRLAWQRSDKKDNLEHHGGHGTPLRGQRRGSGRDDGYANDKRTHVS